MSILGRVSGLFTRAARSSGGSAISDQQLAATLGVYAGMVDLVLDQPERWLHVEGGEAPGGVVRRTWARVRRLAVGDEHPGSPDWSQQPIAARTDWWLHRIAVTAGTAAATPRLAGLLADQLPLQAALGASASGLAVCAVARENGVEDPEQWVPLLATVIFERDLADDAVAAAVPDHAASEKVLDSDPEDNGTSTIRRLGTSGQRAVKAMWHLAQTLLAVQTIFDERPHGGLLPRIVARLPLIGIAGGWLDERGAIRAAARETQRLVTADPQAATQR